MAAFLVVGVCAMVAISVVVAFGTVRAGTRATAGLRWWIAVSIGALALGGTLGAILSGLAPVRATLIGSLLAFLSAGLLILGTVVGVLAGMLWVLEATEADVDTDGEPAWS